MVRARHHPRYCCNVTPASIRRKIHTCTMQNSVVEPASHGMDVVIAVLPSAFVDTMFRRKDWRGEQRTGGTPRSTTNAEMESVR